MKICLAGLAALVVKIRSSYNECSETSEVSKLEVHKGNFLICSPYNADIDVVLHPQKILLLLPMIIYGIITLGVLVFVHELGHFLLAKWNNVGVLEFAVGFGKKIWKKRVGETTYAIGIIPLGGYVRMVGDDPRMLDPEGEKGTNPSDLIEGRDAKEEISEEEKALLADKSRWFLTKGYWARVSIVLAGPMFNILFAVFLSFCVLILYGRPDLDKSSRPIIGEVVPGYPAEKAGLRSGDYVRSIDGKPVQTWIELATTVADSAGKELVLSVERKGEDGAVSVSEVKVTGTFETSEITALDDEQPKVRKAMIGISAFFDRVPVTVLEAAEIAPLHVWNVTRMTMKGLAAMVSGAISPKHIAGPIFIFKEAGRTAERGLDSLFNFMILLSVSLAVFNLLPIPVLDGGHLLFFTIGALKGEPVSMRIQQLASQVGMFLLLALMLFAVSNDVIRQFPGLKLF